MPRGRPKKAQEPVQESVQIAEKAPDSVEKMNVYALRIWEGQSISLPLVDRVNRVKNGLLKQGFNLDGLSLPVKGFEKYL